MSAISDLAIDSDERSDLFRELAQSAQEIRLLTDVLDGVTSAVGITEVVQRIEHGIKTILPSTNWSSITLHILDDDQQQLRSYSVKGAAASRYWSNLRNGVLAAARDLGVDANLVSYTSAAQIAAVRAAYAEHIDGIAVAPIDAFGIEPAIIEARNAGMPLITFDTPAIAGSAALAYVGTNNYLAGQLAGTIMQRLLPDGGTVATSVDTVVAENGMQRLMGFEDAISGVPIQTLPPFEEHQDPSLGVRLACDILTEHPDLAAVFAACGSNGPSWVNAIQQTGHSGDVKLICFDLLAETVQMLQDGRAQAIIAQREFEIGYRSIELLCRIAVDGAETALEALPESNVLDIGVDVVTLERTDWSMSLADHLRRGLRRRQPDTALRNRIAALDRRLKFRAIGVAEVGAESVIEQRSTFDPATPLAQMMRSARSIVSSLRPPADAGRDAIRTQVSVPMVVRGVAVGAINLESSMPNACSPSDVVMLERVAGAFAMVIENARLFRQLERRAREIELASQRQEALLTTISELSSPVVPIARGILVVPMVGTIDTERAAQFVETLLLSISERKARVVLIDITGVAVVDTSVAHHILQAAQAAQLLGAEVVLVGITPAVAQTVVQLGVVLSSITTRSDLESGFAYALSRVGGRLLYKS